MLEYFPSFLEKTAHFPDGPSLEETDIIVTSVDSEYPITLGYLDSASSIQGVCIIRKPSNLIIYLHTNEISNRKLLINVITSTLTRNLTCKVLLSDPEFEQYIVFYCHVGFIDPVITDDPPAVWMYWSKQVNPALTISTINKAVSSLKKDRVVLNLIISSRLATTLSKIVQFMNEGAGNLFITSYTPNKEAVLGVNAKYIVEGTPEGVTPPRLTPFVFHSHPHVMRK